MKILMTADTVGGVWTYACDLASGLSRSGRSGGGFQIVLATMGAPLNDSQTRDVAALPNVTVEESSYSLEWMEDPWEDVRRAGEWLLELERRHRPDVVHLNGYVHGNLAWRAPALIVGHSCVLSWWQGVKGEEAPAEWREYRRRVRRGLKGASAIVAPTRAMMGWLQQYYGPLKRTLVVPNGRRNGCLEVLPKKPFVLSAGRLWDEAKNTALLEEAARDVEWPVYVAGGTEHPDGSNASFRHLQPLGRLPGEDLAHWMGKAAIYASPARYEPFGLSNVEAAMCGCALVLGDIPTLREVWGASAVFVPPDDAGALADAINALARDDKRREEMARRAQARARKYTPQRMGAGYMKLYQALTGSPAKVAGRRVAREPVYTPAL